MIIFHYFFIIFILLCNWKKKKKMENDNKTHTFKNDNIENILCYKFLNDENSIQFLRLYSQQLCLLGRKT